METVKVDMQKLQLLNERIAQTIDALNQLRLSVHGIQHTPVSVYGGYPNIGSFGTYGVYNPYAVPQQLMPQSFGPQSFAPQAFAPQSFAPQAFAPQAFVQPSSPAWVPPIYSQQGLSHTTWVPPIYSNGLSHTAWDPTFTTRTTW